MRDPYDRLQQINEVLGAVLGGILGRGAIAAVGRGIASGAIGAQGVARAVAGGAGSRTLGRLGVNAATRKAIGRGAGRLVRSGALGRVAKAGGVIARNPVKTGIGLGLYQRRRNAAQRDSGGGMGPSIT